MTSVALQRLMSSLPSLQAESSPQEDERCSASERAYIEASTVKRVRLDLCISCCAVQSGPVTVPGALRVCPMQV